MSMKFKNAIAALFVGCFVSQPICAQNWVKVAKTASKQAKKVLSKSSPKSTTTFTKSSPKNSSQSTRVGRSSAVVSQYKTVQCSRCSGKGWYVYNGYKTQCASCSGYGYKLVKKTD